MESNPVTISHSQVQLLLGAANPEAVMLYLFIGAGNPPESAAEMLRLSSARYAAASAVLRQLGLWPQERRSSIQSGERPYYSETDVTQALQSDDSFSGLYQEVQRILGRTLNTEELKILLGFVRYLGLPADVVVTMIYYCRERARQKGNSRLPSLRMIEKEAYFWAENGIDTLEEASAYIQRQNDRRSRLGELLQILQIHGRALTVPEERYALQWLDSGFDNDALTAAYERTCLGTGGMSWAYMDKILSRWRTQGLLSGEAVRKNDGRPDARRAGPRVPDADEAAAIAKLMREG